MPAAKVSSSFKKINNAKIEVGNMAINEFITSDYWNQYINILSSVPHNLLLKIFTVNNRAVFIV